eukprot:183631-Rhodomonas_salina.4
MSGTDVACPRTTRQSPKSQITTDYSVCWKFSRWTRIRSNWSARFQSRSKASAGRSLYQAPSITSTEVRNARCVSPYEISGTDLVYAPTRNLGLFPTIQVSSPICLRACYAMSSTDLVHGTISLRVCWAKSGTDLVCDATRHNLYLHNAMHLAHFPFDLQHYSPVVLSRCYGATRPYASTCVSTRVHASVCAQCALSGTDLGYGASQCPHAEIKCIPGTKCTEQRRFAFDLAVSAVAQSGPTVASQPALARIP